MSPQFIPFVLIPLLVYTYFFINPLAFSTFMDGVVRYIIEIYLGYKAWKIELASRIAYRRYRANAERIARQSGYPNGLVKQYLKTYKAEDWDIIRKQQRRLHEEKYRDFEDELESYIPV